MANEGVDSSRNASIENDDDNKKPPAQPKKVKVHFVAVGSAPIMKKTKFQIGADERFAAVTTFLRKMLKLSGSGSSLFLYCHSSFVPSPDQLVGELSDCFSVRDELVIHYSLQEAWG
jgi:ubiquitin-like protein ATG12